MNKFIFLSALILGSSLSAEFTNFSDAFDQGTLDATIWTSGGYASPITSVTGDGELLLSVNGSWTHSHNAFVQTMRDDFDFFSNKLKMTWVLGPSGLGTDLPYIPNPNELWGENVDRVIMGWGITGNAESGDLQDGGTDSSLFIGITFLEQDESIQLTSSDEGGPLNLELIPSIMGEEIDAIPTSVEAVIDGTNVTLTLTGANFVSTSTNTVVVPHGKTADNFPAFYLTGFYQQQVWQEFPVVTSTDSISVSLAPEASFTDFSDAFDQGTLDATAWTHGGYSTPVVEVTSDGELLLSIVGSWAHSHHAFAQTVRDDFDFFSNTLDLTWELGPSGLGTDLPYIPNPNELWGENIDRVTLGWGITGNTSASDLQDGGKDSSLFFGITFLEQDESVQLTSSDEGGPLNLELIPSIMGEEIDAIPTAVEVVLDSTHAILTLTGANFVSTGTNTATVAHGKTADNFPGFYLTGFYEQQVWQENPILISTDSISVTTAAETAKWNGYPMFMQDGVMLVDTGDFLGWLVLGNNDPEAAYVFSYALEVWVYVAGVELSSPAGNWVYFFK